MSTPVARDREISDATLDYLGVAAGAAAWLAGVLPVAVDGSVGEPRVAAWLATAVLFLVVFLLNARAVPAWLDRLQAVVLVTLFGVLLVLQPSYGTNGIFAVIAITSVAYAASTVLAGTVAVGQAAALAAMMYAVGEPGSLVAALTWGLAYLGMQLFALVMVAATSREYLARQDLAAAQAALAEASRAEERLRMARDLHDQVGHQLTGLALHLEAATHLAAGTPAAEPVERCRVLAKDTLADVRAVVAGWRGEAGADQAGTSYDGAALEARLRELARAVPAPRVVVRVRDLPALSAAAFDALVRAAQEAITNAARHSGARELRLDVIGEDGEVVLRAVDDGRGAGEVVAGNGLTGMRERFARLGGLVTATGAPEQGFRVVARLPERP
ncbi:MAG: sensor histidine kinase [Austwickia sp.]|jgi:signal transduction histidine kinase|nr:MAG: sensor histidine kinase [Austwickia sp.]